MKGLLTFLKHYEYNIDEENESNRKWLALDFVSLNNYLNVRQNFER